MADFDWETRVYSITDKENEAVYVGEAKINVHEGYVPSGAGAFYSKKDNILLVSEDMVNKTGIGIKADSNETMLGILKDGYINGPAIFAKKDAPLILTPFCMEDKINKYAYIQMDNFEEYFICQLDDSGAFTGKTIHYKMGRFYLEMREKYNVETTPIREIECSWDYKPFYSSFMASPIDLNKPIRPLNVTSVSLKGKPYYKFAGGAQTNSKKLKTYTLEDYSNIEYFQDDANGYGVSPINKGDMYIGEFINNRASGLGCISYTNGSKYVGFIDSASPHGLGLLVNNKEIVFSSFLTGLRHGLTIEFVQNSMFIKVYQDLLGRDPAHDYFEINLKTFNIKNTLLIQVIVKIYHFLHQILQ